MSQTYISLGKASAEIGDYTKARRYYIKAWFSNKREFKDKNIMFWINRVHVAHFYSFRVSSVRAKIMIKNAASCINSLLHEKHPLRAYLIRFVCGNRFQNKVLGTKSLRSRGSGVSGLQLPQQKSAR